MSDDLHSMLLKSCASAHVFPLFNVLERSLVTSQLPDDWKKSLLVPIFINKTLYDPLNYRPVSLTSVCCKTMERVLAAEMINYLEANS